MEALALPLAIAGTAFSVGGSIFGGLQESAMLKANAKAVRSQTAADVEDIRRKNARLLGTVAARTGASGLLMEGSPLEVLADDAAEAELEAQRRQWQGDTEARMLKQRARSAVIGGFAGAGASLLSGGSRIAGLLGQQNTAEAVRLIGYQQRSRTWPAP